MLDRIKRILGLSLEVDNTNEDFLLEQFIDMYSNALALEINETMVPQQLEFILIEVVCARWNKRGQEGLLTESIDVVSQTFHAELLDPYRIYLNTYKNNKATPKSNRVKFI